MIYGSVIAGWLLLFCKIAIACAVSVLTVLCFAALSRFAATKYALKDQPK